MEESTTDPPSVERTISPKTAFELAQGAADAAAESQGETINGLRADIVTMREDSTKRDKWARYERVAWLIALLILAGKAIGLDVIGLGSFSGGP